MVGWLVGWLVGWFLDVNVPSTSKGHHRTHKHFSSPHSRIFGGGVVMVVVVVVESQQTDSLPALWHRLAVVL